MKASEPRILVSLFGVVLCAPISAQVTQRVSMDSSGAQGNEDCHHNSISANGRYVAFDSDASNFVPVDTNGFTDVFVRDRQNGTTERVSVDSARTQGNGRSFRPAISADGRYVSFYSYASNLVPGDTNVKADVFVRDLQNGSTERVSLDSVGGEGNGHCSFTAISDDGRYIAFESVATNLVTGDTNAFNDIFVRDRQSGTTERVTVATGGAEGNGACRFPSISGDGRAVAFESNATNLITGTADTNGKSDVFLRDRQLGTTVWVSVDSAGVQGNNNSFDTAISADGRYVAFSSQSTNLVAGDTNGTSDVFLRDRQLGTTVRESVTSGGGQGAGYSTLPAISADGRYVGMGSFADNLVPGDMNGVVDTFVRDRLLGTIERVSDNLAGTLGNGGGFEPSFSADGRYVAFASRVSNLVPDDTNGFDDVFVHDRLGAPDFTSSCNPGVGGVIPCPCSNPPGGLGRGCNNSAATGGAILSASGGTYLSSDSLVFTTSGEKPTALSIVAQWAGGSATGVAFGQGVRCTSGALKRLYAKSASGGSITAPNFGAGDLSVHAQSAAKGDTILAGQSRWYVVYYRDNTVLGGCPASSNFNATQTGQVTWSP